MRHIQSDLSRGQFDFMVTESEYINGWLLYLGGALGAMVVWWYMTRNIPNKILRDLLRLTVLVVAVTPFSVGEDIPFLAPAAMITMVEGFLMEESDFARGGVPILIALAISYLVYFIAYALWQRYWVKRQARQGEEAKLMADHDELVAESRKE